MHHVNTQGMPLSVVPHNLQCIPKAHFGLAAATRASVIQRVQLQPLSASF